MKIIATIVLATAIFSARVFAQGYVTFSAGSTDLITYSTDGVTYTKAPVGSPSMIPGWGELNIAFYTAPAGTVLNLDANGVPDLSSWNMASTILHNIGPFAGYVSGNIISLSGSTGNPVQMEIVGWTGTATSWASAESDLSSILAWTGSGYNGGALGWTQPTGTSTAPANVKTGTGGFNGLSLAVPEPSPVALAGWGAVILALFWKRKAFRVGC